MCDKVEKCPKRFLQNVKTETNDNKFLWIPREVQRKRGAKKQSTVNHEAISHLKFTDALQFLVFCVLQVVEWYAWDI